MGHRADSEKHIEAFRLRQSGATYKEIGKHFGVGPQRAKELVVERQCYLEFMDGPDGWKAGLSARAVHALSNADIRSKDQLMLVLSKGFSKLLKTRNVGRKTMFEICEWAGHEINFQHQDPIKKKIASAIELLENFGYRVSLQDKNA
jgi:hypothetical protein